MLDAIIDSLVAHPLTTLVSCVLPLIAIYVTHALFFASLSNIPGPLLRRLTSLPLLYTSYVGSEASVAAALHAKYGPIVLVGPNDVDIADGAAVGPIYVDKGGFRKAACYRNFDVDGHESIFSTLDPAHRAVRAKSVAGMFAMGKLRDTGVIAECAGDLVWALREARANSRGAEVNILDLGRRLALDSLSGYLYGRRYGAFQEYKGTGLLSASPFVDSFVAVSRFFLLPSALFGILDTILPKIFPDKAIERASEEVDAFVKKLVEDADTIGGDTYQKRLLGAGISKDETVAQCKDLIFAGTDSTGMNLATLIWRLVQQPDILHKLHAELTSSDPAVKSTPLLHATIREGLRVAMANPTRLPRIVPLEGWIYTPSSDDGYISTKSFRLLAGTAVGVSSYSLHFNEATYPSPLSFDPMRWISLEDGQSLASAEMTRDQFAFGAGSRQCIARNLATEELTVALRLVVESGVLDGAEAVGNDIPFLEWFNSKVSDGKGVRIRWPL